MHYHDCYTAAFSIRKMAIRLFLRTPWITFLFQLRGAFGHDTYDFVVLELLCVFRKSRVLFSRILVTNAAINKPMSWLLWKQTNCWKYWDGNVTLIIAIFLLVTKKWEGKILRTYAIRFEITPIPSFHVTMNVQRLTFLYQKISLLRIQL